MLDWLCKVYVIYYVAVRLRIKLAVGLGDPGAWDVGNPQGCPLNMKFIVALCVPWYGHVDGLDGVSHPALRRQPEVCQCLA